MNTEATSVPLAHAKAHLSQVVRTVRETGRPVTVTVNGQPAVQIAPVAREPRRLTQAQIDEFNAGMEQIRAMFANEPPFDAVELIRDGRR